MGSIQKAVEVLKSGGIIAYPTEACFGLGCLMSNEQGISRIRQLKKRPAAQGIIIVSDTLSRVEHCIHWDLLTDKTQKRIIDSWPSAVTWLLPVAKNCPQSLTGKNTTLAVRLPDFEPISAICAGAKSAMVSTSANLKGQPPLNTAHAVLQVFADELDAIVDLPIMGRVNPSQIIDAMSLQTIRPA